MKKLSDLFLINYGAGSNLSYEIMEKSSKGINFVSRTSKNNGVVGKVKKIYNLNPNPKMSISVAAGGSVLSAFLQPEEYYVGRDVFVLVPINEMKVQELLFYCLCIQNNKKKYSYGRQANRTLKNILVPDITEIPEWVYDQNNDKLSIKLINEVYNNNIIVKNFKISDLFEIDSGKEIIESLQKGNVPLVSAISKNNGISNYVSSPKKIFLGNCLTVTANGSPGDTFYQKNEFCATSDINILIPKFNMNKYSALYLCTILKKEKFKFNYGRKWVDYRMVKHEISLPVNANGDMNLLFMETYISKVMNVYNG